MSLDHMTPEQIEALIRWQHDPGARYLTDGCQDTESAVELECYVAGKLVTKSEEADEAA